MKYIKQIPSVLLGLVFFVFGLNFFFPFMPMPPQTPSDATTFGNLLYSSGYLAFVKVLEISIGLLLFIPRTRALALILIAPIVVNILLFEIFLQHKPSIGVALILLNAIGIIVNKDKYLSIIK
ncbi:MAG: hypothetical protein ACOVO1_13020 [Chitinophagaceae bacterium]